MQNVDINIMHEKVKRYLTFIIDDEDVPIHDRMLNTLKNRISEHLSLPLVKSYLSEKRSNYENHDDSDSDVCHSDSDPDNPSKLTDSNMHKLNHAFGIAGDNSHKERHLCSSLVQSHKSLEQSIKKPMIVGYKLVGLVTKSLQDSDIGMVYKVFTKVGTHSWHDQDDKKVGSFTTLSQTLKADKLFPVTVVYQKMSRFSQRLNSEMKCTQSVL